MNALFAPGAKRTRILAAFGLTLLLAAPAMLVWANRPYMLNSSDESQAQLRYDAEEARRLAAVPLPPAFMPLPENSPFGGAFRAHRASGDQANDILRTSIGDVSWDLENDPFIKSLKPGLRFGQQDGVARGPKGQLRPGLDFVRLSQAASDVGLDAALRSVADHATILSVLANRTLLVKVEANQMQALRSLEVVDRAAPYLPAFKLTPTYGGRPEIMKLRASEPFVRSIVTVVPGESVEAVAKDLRAMQGVRNVTEEPFGYQVQAEIHNQALERVVRDDRILSVDLERDEMTSAMEAVPAVQAGSCEDADFQRPFDRAGVDGGGINASGLAGLGNRNDDSAIVPPQIVLVVDNGISVDTPNFSQTATQVTTPTIGIGPSHRKVHQIQAPVDGGTSCDAPLSGSGTHGHTVASLIGANLTAFGVFISKAGIGDGVQVRNGNFDGVARGSRILLEDVAGTGLCNINEVVEHGGNVTPGILADRLNFATCPTGTAGNPQPLTGPCASRIGGGTQVHVGILPFGAPSNFSTIQFGDDNGTYPQEAVDVDRFLYNNRDFAVFSPVGNNGGLPGTNRIAFFNKRIPDLFNGTAIDENPNNERKPQISPPATAKNVITVGSTRGEAFTAFGTNNQEMNTARFSSRGPATGESRRQAPIMTAYGFDLVDEPYTGALAVVRSTDNDNLAPIDAELDEGNFGTSYSAALLTGAGAVIRDYFAQGFYPTGERGPASDRIPNVSGSLLKAMLIASTDFTHLISGQDSDAHEGLLLRSRCTDLGTVTGLPGTTAENIGIMCNSEAGYGRPILTHVLPLSNWSDEYIHNVFRGGGGQPFGHPAPGLLLYDRIGTGEPLINNTATPCAPGANCSQISHTFRVAGPQTLNVGGAIVVANREMRIGLAWPEQPGGLNDGGPLINDLDMTLESPGPDNCLTSADTKPDGSACPGTAADDNKFYDGNNYFTPAAGNSIKNIYSASRTAAVGTEKHDCYNPQEAIHLHSDMDTSAEATVAASDTDSPLYVGRWKITVKRGHQLQTVPTLECKATVNDIVIVPVPTDVDATPGDEDDNGNGRLDLNANFDCGSGEDNNGNCQLDQPGQPYSLAIAGPVLRDAADLAPAKGPTSFPGSLISFSAARYGCDANATLSITDSTGSATAANVKANTTFEVRNFAGALVDSEANFDFTPGATPGLFSANLLPVRLAGPAISGNGLLEGDTGFTITATYNRAPQRAIVAKAGFRCSPELVPGAFLVNNNTAFGDQFIINGGCDNDENLDAGEVVTYGMALNNVGVHDGYSDVIATLTPSGPGAAAITVLDSPKNTGTLAIGQTQGVFFHVLVNGAAIPAAVVDRKVTMTLTLESVNKGVRIGRQSYSFTHALNSDRETFNYSTDYPGGSAGEPGGLVIADKNRNLEIDPVETVDPFFGYIISDEQQTFSSLFGGTSSIPGIPSNLLGEDLNNNNAMDTTERDIQPNAPPYGPVDRGILIDTNPANTQRVPWNFDNNDGGWRPFRHAASTVGKLTSTTPLWEYNPGAAFGNSGLCGFQTEGGAGKFGVWHTGDGDSNTPGVGATACENHTQPFDPDTSPMVEILFDVLESPVIAKVNQLPDARGFPYTVEFRRFGMNETIQITDGYAGGGINIDSNADSDNITGMLSEQLDAYYTRRLGGWPHGLTRQTYEYFSDYIGIDPANYYQPHQRTFGSFTDTNGSVRICVGGVDPGKVCDRDSDCPGRATPPPVIPPGTCEVDNPAIPGVMDLTGDESGFTAFTENSNPDSTRPIPEAKDVLATGSLQMPYPLPGAIPMGVCDGGDFDNLTCDPGAPVCPNGGVCRTAQNTVAGPVRNYEINLVSYEGGGGAVLQDPTAIEYVLQYTPGKAGNRWQIGLGFWAIESASGAADLGMTIDDPVFEWREWHPVDEGALGHPAACTRFGGIGQPAGGQCASLTADRTTLYECDESMEVTVYDAKCRSLGAGNTVPLYGACTTNAQCGASPNGVCSAAFPSVQVQVVTDTDSVPTAIATGLIINYPNSKLYTLPAVPGSPGLYRGTIIFSTTTNDNQHVFTSPGQDNVFSIYYHDPVGDCDGDGQAAEDNFNNVDGDGCPGAAGCLTTDNCPQLYNPAPQADADGDGIGDLCDNCPNVSNVEQRNSTDDGVGDACDFDDIDGDGTSNATDNCPDLFNDDQADSDDDGRGDACDVGGDRDGDIVPDTLDNCVLVSNAAQDDHDGDGLGDACDGDCQNAVSIFRCINNGVQCGTSVPNEALCGPLPNQLCQPYVSHTGTCGLVDDDFDQDGNFDAIDNCPTQFNPEIIAGTLRQRDRDRDTIGDACDPTGTFDDAIDGIPDDVVTFNGTVLCRALPLAALSIDSVEYQDYDGDHDPNPDTGEFGRIRLTLTNTGPSLTDATLVLTTTDPDVACLTKPTLFVGSWASNGQKVLGDFVPGNPGFEFKASESLTFAFPPHSPTVDFCITMIANETLGMGAPVCFKLGADRDFPGGPGDQTFVMGPDGLAGTADDGVITENFDIDKNGDGEKGVQDSFLQKIGGSYFGYCSTAPTTTCQIDVVSGHAVAPLTADSECPSGGFCQTGAYIRGSALGSDLNTVGAVQCAGFDAPAPGELGCRLDPDYPMDWHYHCPNGASDCPNTESGPCFGGCTYDTPQIPNLTGIGAGLSGTTSLHMGGHWDPLSNELGDGQHFRTLQAFMTPPMNLALFPCQGAGPSCPQGAQPLEMSFFHVARLADNNAVGGIRIEHQCKDCGDVQIQLDIDPNSNPNIEQWGDWDKLQPSVNVYDKKADAFSVFGVNNCSFTPTDTGTGTPAPNGFHETMCFPMGAWSRCGHTGLGAPGGAGDCLGQPTSTVRNDPTGSGVWVQTKFNMAPYLGQRIRIRWIGRTWEFNENAESYFQLGAPWNTTLNDDGWWLDDIRVQGLITSQLSPIADTRPSPGGVCPAAGCNEGVGPDNGTNVVLQITDLALNILDGVTTFPVAGQQIRVTAINSTLPGGCVPGVPEFQFFKNGSLVQDWGPKTFYLDAPDVIATYQVKERCSVDFTCTSASGASIIVHPDSGDSSDTYFANPPDPNFGVRYYRGKCSAVGAGHVIGDPCNAGYCSVSGASCLNTAACLPAPASGVCTTVETDCGVGGTCGGIAAGSLIDTGGFADDTQRVSICGVAGASPACGGGPCMDLYRGTANGEAYPVDNVAKTSTLGTVAFHSHPANVGVCAPGLRFVGNYTMLADADPETGYPAAGTAFYYDSVGHIAGGPPVNTLSCTNPGICTNTGWCDKGTAPGTPCTIGGAACAGGGVCTNMAGVSKPYCSSDTGMGDLGGCGKHSVCVGGTNAGGLCLNLSAAAAVNPVCTGAGATCSGFVAASATAGNFCYKTDCVLPAPPGYDHGVPIQVPPLPVGENHALVCAQPDSFHPAVPVNQGCLDVGHPERVIDKAALVAP